MGYYTRMCGSATIDLNEFPNFKSVSYADKYFKEVYERLGFEVTRVECTSNRLTLFINYSGKFYNDDGGDALQMLLYPLVSCDLVYSGEADDDRWAMTLYSEEDGSKELRQETLRVILEPTGWSECLCSMDKSKMEEFKIALDETVTPPRVSTWNQITTPTMPFNTDDLGTP